jgi:hypothetical protein
MDAVNAALLENPENRFIFSICTDFIKIFLLQYGIPEKHTVIYDKILHIHENVCTDAELPKRLQFAWEEILRMLPG